MSAIYKCYKGSELEEVLVAGGEISDGSVEHALKGKHYKRGLRCLRLMYEALIGQQVQDILCLTWLMSQSQESRAYAHAALQDDVKLRASSQIYSTMEDLTSRSPLQATLTPIWPGTCGLSVVIGHCWELVDGCCRTVRHTQPALPKHLPAPSPAEASEEYESDYDDEKDDDVQGRKGDSSEDDDTECSDSD
ncbi:hypothetical protein SK128_008934 [Halocaridina rubra]|uniref:Uncharacterized protein n=1 Tax=Halocaridina rubra TaxID=373956 RepID=A0AAN8WQP1_HALRR